MTVITVKGTGKNNRVALWEKNPDHPNGEVFIVHDGKPVQAAETAAVKRLLGEGVLVKTTEVAPAIEDKSEKSDKTDENEDTPRRRKMSV